MMNLDYNRRSALAKFLLIEVIRLTQMIEKYRIWITNPWLLRSGLQIPTSRGLSNNQVPMITPVSFGYQMPLGFGVDFKFGVNMFSAFDSFERLDNTTRRVTGHEIWHGPKY